MFNRSYQMRAVREAGGGHQVAKQFYEDDFYRPKTRVRPGKVRPGKAAEVAAKDCKNSSGRLQGVQLELFAAGPGNEVEKPARNARQSPANASFPPLAADVPCDDEQPLSDLFPEAYL
jgi:hypothetical protein